MREQKIKILNISLVVVLLINMVLFALQKISNLQFWVVIAVIGIFAYFVMPKLKKN